MKDCQFLFTSMSSFSRKKVYGGEIVNLRENNKYFTCVFDASLRWRFKEIHTESIYSKMTSRSSKARDYATLRAFVSRTLRLCSTWFVITRRRNVCCSCAILHALPGTMS